MQVTLGTYDAMCAETGIEELRGFDGLLQNARYVPVAEHVLGAALLPEQVRLILAETTCPEGLSWQGTPVWESAYFTALGPVGLARRIGRNEAREVGEHQGKSFAADWYTQYLSGGTASHFTELDAVLQRSAFQDSEAGRARRQRVARAAQNVRLANALLSGRALPSDEWADQDGPRARLQAFFRDAIRWFTISPPRSNELTKVGTQPLLNHALLIVSPTGVGKTIVGGDYLAATMENPSGTGYRTSKALWITVSQALVQDCLNPKKSLQRCLGPDVKVTAIWEDHKNPEDTEGDVVVLTIQSLEDALEKKLILPKQISRMVFDESHRGLSPRLLELLKRFDCPKLLMTATPTRSEQRSQLNQYHYLRPVSRLEAIEEGMLSPARILTYRAQTMAHAENIAARAAAELFVCKGRKAVIYCQAGGDNAQARRMARLVDMYARDLMGDDYDPDLSYAEMVGKSRDDSQESIRAFEEQTHGGVRATCQMLGEGWDHAELDGAIWVGAQTDLLALEQESGRPLRPKQDGREALLIEVPIALTENDSDRARYCLAQTFGLQDVPGAEVVLGPRPGGGGHPGGGLGPGPGSKPGGGRPGTGDRPDGYDDPGGGQGADDSFKDRLSPELQEYLVEGGTLIAEIIIEPGRIGSYVPPEGFSTTDTELSERFNVPVPFVHYHFEGRGEVPPVGYKLIRRTPTGFQEQEDEERIYQRYYDTAALTAYLAAYPMPATHSERIYTLSTMGRMLHAGGHITAEAIRELGLPDREPTVLAKNVAVEIRGGKAAPRYTLDEFTAITKWVEQVPVAEPTQIAVSDALSLFPFLTRRIKELERVIRRHPPEVDRQGRDPFITTEELVAALAEHARRSALIPLDTVARRAGVTPQVLRRQLTPEERAFAFAESNRFAPPGGTRFAPHVTTEIADDLVERVKPRGLEPFEVPFPIIEATVNAPSTTALNQFLRGIIRPYMRKLPDSPYSVSVFPAILLVAAIDRFGVREGMQGAETIDHKALPLDASASESVLAYGRHVQRAVLGVAEAKLAPNPVVANPAGSATGEPLMAVAAVPPALPEAGNVMDNASHEDPSPEAHQAASGPSAASATRANEPAVESQEQALSLDAVLAILNCTPAVLAIMLRHIPDSQIKRDEDRKLTGIHRAAIAQLKQARSELAQHPVGWVSLAVLLKIAKENKKELPKLSVSPNECKQCISPDTGTADIYYSLNAARSMVNMMRRAR